MRYLEREGEMVVGPRWDGRTKSDSGGDAILPIRLVSRVAALDHWDTALRNLPRTTCPVPINPGSSGLDGLSESDGPFSTCLACHSCYRCPMDWAVILAWLDHA